MLSTRSITKLAASAVLLASLAACADSPAAPSGPSRPAPAPSAGLISDLLTPVVGDSTANAWEDQTTLEVNGLVGKLLTCNVTQRYQTTKTIGAKGGVIVAGPHSLVIPKGALTSNVSITAVVPEGTNVEVQFYPHGLQFRKPAALTMSYQQCGAIRGLFMGIVYVDEQKTIKETLLSFDDILNQRVTGKLTHFSSYMVAFRGGAVEDASTTMIEELPTE